MHKMAEKFGKSWVLISIYPSRLNHIIDWWHCSRLIHTWKIATHNYLPNSNQIFLSLNCDSKNWTAKLCLRSIKVDNIQTERLSYGKICGERRLFHDLINNYPGNRQNLKPQGSLCVLLLLSFLFRSNWQLFSKVAALKFCKVLLETPILDFCFSCRA